MCLQPLANEDAQHVTIAVPALVSLINPWKSPIPHLSPRFFCGLVSFKVCWDKHLHLGCSQDSLIVNLVKPFNVRVVLNSKACGPAGEV